MADIESDLFMDLLKKLAGFGEDKALSAIFGDPTSPILPDIEEAIRQEFDKAFFQQSAEVALIDAAGEVKAAEQFLAIDYQNALAEAKKAIDGATDKAAETKTQNTALWTLLDASSTAPGLSALVASAGKLEDWIKDAAGREGGDKIAGRAATIYLGTYLHICLFHSERSKVADIDSTKARELDDLRDKARFALDKMTSHVAALVEARLNCLQYLSSPTNSTWDQLTDTWFAPSDNNIVYSGTVPNDFNKDYIAALRTATNATRRLLFNGEQVSADACWNAVRNNGWLAGPHNAQMDRREDYLGQTFTSDWDFGKWAADSRDLLMQLDVMATGTGGVAQDQWACCGNCGVLHYNNAASQCPAPGTGGTGHLALQSPNYVVHGDLPSPPAGTQAEWRWCKNCGGLHFGGGGGSVCPNGKGPHVSDGSGNYLLVATSDTQFKGLPAEDGWKWCNKCGVLHSGTEKSVCPADGGSHATDGSADYRLGKIGNALWPFVHDFKHDDFPG